MSPLTVNLELPRELLSALDVSESGLGDRILELVVFELIREGRISQGKGAELLGLSFMEFLPLLNRQDIPYFSISSEELLEEVAAVVDLSA